MNCRATTDPRPLTTATIPAGSVVARDLSALLTPHAISRPNRIALGTSDLRVGITYGELDRLVRIVAGEFVARGLRRGQPVAIAADGSIEFVIAFLAVITAGSMAVPLNPHLSGEEIESRLAALSIQVVVTPKNHALPTMHAHPELWPIAIGIDGVEIGDGNTRTITSLGCHQRNLPVLAPDDVAMVLFTAGSTSTPKAVPLTHRNLLASIRGICTTYDLSPADSTLLVMPLFHGHGLVAGLLATLATGGRASLPASGSFSAHRFWPDMVRVGATWFTAVPTIHRILFDRAAQEYPAASPPHLRFIRSCSAPLDAGLAAAVSRTFDAPMIAAYGMTETAHQATSNPLPEHGANRTPAVGLPTGLELRIVDEEGKEAAPQAIGEIQLRGDAVTHGYLDNPDANAASFTNGWFRTGDLGRLDNYGYLAVTGRMKEVINRGGEKISPDEIDAVLLANPNVLEAASFGEADALYGEDVNAAVVLRPGMTVTEDELRAYCREHLVQFEVPERIHVLPDFPRTAKGSIDRHALAALFAQQVS